MICMSRVFVYDAVDVNKIVAVSSIKLPSYPYAQATVTLVDLPIHGEHCKPNPKSVD